MNEKELKTSTGQRVGIIIIAVIMLGSIIASYVAIVAGGNKTDDSSTEISEEKKQQYTIEYERELAEFKEITVDDFNTFVGQLSAIYAFDEETANANDVTTKELVLGNGRELTEGDTNYLAYYVGWCADGSVFDASVDDIGTPTTFLRALDPSNGLIEGWNTGVVGMKLGGIRRLTIPGEKAYGSSKEICGGYDKPLRFMVMAVANEEPLKSAAAELETAYMRVQYANYGMDYDAVVSK